MFLACLVLGIVPMVVYATIVWRLDRWEKEPLPLLLAAFFWGAIPAVIFSIIAQVIFDLPVMDLPESASPFVMFYQSSFVAPLTEEIIKGFGLLAIFVFFRREIDSVLDGLVYGSMVGFGFSAVENILYFSGESEPIGLFGLFFLRAFVFGMLHALFTGLFGVGLALGKFARHPALRIFWPLLGLTLGMLTHSLHNTFAVLGGENILYAVLGVSLGILWFIGTFAACLYHENRWIRLHLADEVAEGVLHAEQAIDTASFWRRFTLASIGYGWTGARARHRLFHEATELAFEKQRHQRFGAGQECLDRLEKLRDEVRRLSGSDPRVLAGEYEAGRKLPPPLPPSRRRPPPLPEEPS